MANPVELRISGSDTPISSENPYPVTGGGTVTNPSVVGGNVASGATDSGNPVKVAGVYNATLPTVTTGQRVDVQADARGNLRVYPSASTSTGVDAVPNGQLMSFGEITTQTSVTVRPISVGPYKFNGTTWDRDRKPNATSRIPSAAASTNATSAKASAGDLHCISGYNAAATVRYIKFYAKATAPTVGTDTPVITLALQPTSAFNINMNGHYIATGIAYALTTGAADADTGALTAGDVLGLTITYA